MGAVTHTLVVGGTRGIGRAIARRFAEAGGTVSVFGRTAPSGVDGASRFWQVDAADAAALSAALTEAVDANGPLAHVVLLQRFRGDGDSWQGELDVSLTATKTVVEGAVGSFAEGGGSIVILSSNASRLVAGEQPVGYHAAKAALVQMARYYAVALGPKGIRVNCVTPGAVLKDESRDAFLAAPHADRIRAATPLRRIPEAEEVAAAVVALCGPDLALVTGQEIVVDAGLSLLWQESLIRELTGDGS
jgi:NAD(P)-dependent dehydrogenase (short-subunit alcohol dehydrogenase family)